MERTISNSPLDYVAYGVSAELLGIENIDGVDHYALKYTGPAESFSEFYYFNVETGILGSSKSIVETEEGPMTSTSKYNNYIKLNSDVVYPLEVLTKEGPQSMNLRISTIDINTEIDTNKFNLN